MALEEKKDIHQIEVMSDWVMFLKEKIEIFKDGVLVLSTWHRTCVTPDDDKAVEKIDYTVFKNIAYVVRTKEVKDAYKVRREKEKERAEKIIKKEIKDDKKT